MTVRLCLFDETSSGESRQAGELVLGAGTITLRNLIRERVRLEVEAYNDSLPERPTERVPLTGAERVLNGERRGPDRPLNGEEQFDRAIRSFEANGFLVIAGDRQLIDLDEEVRLRDGEAIRFLRLLPLAGG